MSVLRIPLRVTRTQIVPTAKVLMAALVNKDLVEMESFVKILMNVLRIPAHVKKTLIVLTLRGPTAVV